MHALQVSRPTPRGEVEGSDKGGGVVSRPTPRGGKLRGLAPGGGLQAHTRGGGELRGLAWGVSGPTIAGGQYTSYWNALLLNIVIPMINKQ